MKISGIRKIIPIGLLSMAFSLQTQAAVTFFSQTNNFSVTSTNSTQSLTFNLASTATGSAVVLSDIDSISITGIINSDGGAWSASATSPGATFVVGYTTKGWFTSTKPIGIAGNVSSPSLLSLYSSPSFFLSGGQSNTGTTPTASSGILGGALANTAFTDFLGSGTFGIDIVMTQNNDGSSTNPSRNGTIMYTSRPTLSGEVVVTYGIIPEPSALSLLLVGLTGLVTLRRTRRAV